MASEQHQVARHFSRAAANYHQHDAIQQYFGQQLVSALPDKAGQLVDVGCGPGAMRPALAQRCQNYLGIDLAAGMVQQAKSIFPQDIWLEGCAEQLPLKNNSMDAYFANLSLQWSPCLGTALGEALRVLKPGGQAVFNLPVAGTFAELISCWQSVDQRPHTQRFYSLAEIFERLQALGLTDYQYQLYEQQQYFADLRSLLGSIKGVGANYVGPRESAGLLSPGRFQQVIQNYEQHRVQKGLPLSWKVASLCFYKQVN